MAEDKKKEEKSKSKAKRGEREGKEGEEVGTAFLIRESRIGLEGVT